MEKGVTKYWTPEQEKFWQRRLSGCRTFAQRNLVMTWRDLIKYDARTREGKKALAKARLRIAVATDDDLRELAYLETIMTKPIDFSKQAEIFNSYKKLQEHLREKGIKRGELECQRKPKQ